MAGVDNQEMDFAAMDAGKELAQLDAEAVKALAAWWKKWYMQAGHKRLAWQLMGTIRKEA